ncbi:unnamed protein product [Rotaria sp. Silwood1]|nr:unnamed protein product [Rotaria sp. Silwood1]CAF1079785.1 unnamed protein product [Rotaria sp. Silwood1]CAF3410433.1 unnamed protein product [Rotaria sp. Silwood1]CAF4834188.1 unnamed protein product [Rotaria sp. Silwood1]
MRSIVLIFLCLHAYFTEHASIEIKDNLTKLDCTYTDAIFGRIDLSRVGLKHGIPAFRHVLKEDYFYSYNPCYPFSEKSSCTNVAICQIAKDGSAYYALGFNAMVSWSVTLDGNVTLVYSTEDRQTIVNLACWNEIDQLAINGEYALRHYNLTLFSKCACWNGC